MGNDGIKDGIYDGSFTNRKSCELIGEFVALSPQKPCGRENQFAMEAMAHLV